MTTKHTPGPGASPEPFEAQCPSCGREAGACICEQWTFSDAAAVSSLLLSQPPAFTVRYGLDAIAIVLMPAFETRAGVLAEKRARLIAAAPETAAERDRLREINAELLAALEQLTRSVIGVNGIPGKRVSDVLLDDARAALAKAKGE
jgi:hypothetical protein